MDLVQLVLSLPVSGGVLGLLAVTLAPQARWTRALKNDLAIYKDLPDGPQKDAYERRVVAMSQRLVDYRDVLPTTEKVVSWTFFALGLVTVVSFVVTGIPKSIEGMNYAYGAGWPIVAGLASVLMFVGGFNALRGRSLYGMTGEGWKQYRESERASYAKADRRRLVKKRAKRAAKAQSKLE